MTEPFFSVILPTRDRVTLAADVVRHTLGQSYANFELVVVDNGTDDAASRAALGFGDPRVRIVRTGGLNMPDNWQAGLDAAHGRYVVMVEDKLFLVADALEQCAALLQGGEAPLLAWMLGTCDGPGCPSLAPAGHCPTSELPTSDFFRYGTECMIDRYQKQAPRGLNMAVGRDFVQHIQERAGKLCRLMAPDYSMGALPLAFLPSFLHSHKVLARVLKNGSSTGSDVWRRTAGFTHFFESLGVTPANLLDNVPVKIPFLQNLIVGDLLRFWGSAGIPEAKLKLHNGGYLMMLLSELLIAKNHEIPFAEEAEVVRRHFWSQPGMEKARFLSYAVKRFVGGWPDRKAPMRTNLPRFLDALRMLFAPSSGLARTPSNS